MAESLLSSLAWTLVAVCAIASGAIVPLLLIAGPVAVGWVVGNAMDRSYRDRWTRLAK